MKSLLVSGDFTTWGGMDRANYELAWYLAQEAALTVHLVAYQVAEPLASHPNVVWRRVTKPLNSYALGAFMLDRSGRAEAGSIAQRGGRIIVNGGNCEWHDINYVHALQYDWQHRLAHAPAHIRLRHFLFRQRDLRKEWRALHVAKTVVVNSEQTRARVIRHFKIPSDRVHTIYYGIDPDAFYPPMHEERLNARERLGCRQYALTAVFVGALGYERNKGFDLLFEAWRQLCLDPDWDVDLFAAGGGADVAYWQKQAERSGLSARIRMIGFTRNVPELLRAADVMIQPSFYEAYGLGAHEALCCGVPTLVTRTSGIAERYPAELQDLLLESPPSVSNIVESLRRWRADLDGYASRVQQFSKQLRKRTWTDMAREFVQVAMPNLVKASV